MISEAGRKLANYSGAVAGAEAQSELRRERAAINRARQLGPQFANVLRTQAEWEEMTARAMTGLYTLVLRIWKILEPLIQLAFDTFEAILRYIPGFEDVNDDPLFDPIIEKWLNIDPAKEHDKGSVPPA